MVNIERPIVLGVRVPGALKDAIDQYVKQGIHMNLSDFGRAAFREKLTRDAPWLLEEILVKKEVED